MKWKWRNSENNILVLLRRKISLSMKAQAHFYDHISLLRFAKCLLSDTPKAIFLYRPLLYRFSKLVMFCGKCEADNELRFITNLSSSSAHPSDISQHRETSSKVIMSSFFMLAGWKTRIDPGDWHSSWEHRSNSIWLVYERDKFILTQDLLLDYRFKMGR